MCIVPLHCCRYQWELAEGQGEPKLRITITMGPDGPIRLIIKERK